MIKCFWIMNYGNKMTKIEEKYNDVNYWQGNIINLNKEEED